MQISGGFSLIYSTYKKDGPTKEHLKKYIQDYAVLQAPSHVFAV